MISDDSNITAQKQRIGWRNQFALPTGPLGWLAGQLMAVADRERSAWVLSLLDVQPNSRVFEVGFGSGADLQRLSRIVTSGLVAGIDASDVMVHLASRRNSATIRSGRMSLQRQSITESLLYPDATFDIVFSINSFQFWPQPQAALQELRRILRPGGMIAIAVQPMNRGATDETTQATGQMIVESLAAAGFNHARLELKPMRPNAVACGLGDR